MLDDCRHGHTHLNRVPCRLCSAFFPDIVPLLVNVGDKSFFLFSTECRTIINMGMPHLNPLERERLACLLVRIQYVKDMPKKFELPVM